MKIGFSFGRCVRDIVKDLVHFDDVYLIVSRTAIRDSSHIDEVVEEYLHRPDYLEGLDQGKCLDVSYRLYLEGKILQPRLNGHHPRMVAEDMVWMDLSPTILGEDAQAEQVIKAWKQYQLALKMTSLKQFPDPSGLRGSF